MRHVRIGLLLGLLLPALAVRADDGNYRDFLVGDRAAGMGGAANASCSGVDAIYYNPAGLGAPGTNLIAVSGSLYGWQMYRADDATGPGEDAEYKSFVTIPTSVGTVNKVSDNVSAGFAAFVPDYSSFNTIESFDNGNHSYTYNNTSQSVWVGPAAGMKLGPRLRAGLSAFCVYRYDSFAESVYYGDELLSYSINYSARSFGALALAGVQYDLAETWQVGMTAQTPSLHLYGSGDYHLHGVSGQRGGSGDSMGVDMEAYNQIPAAFSWGIAHQRKGRYAIGFDVIYHLPTSFTFISGTADDGEYVARKMHRKAVVDFSLGGEYYISEKYPFRAGVFTSRSSSAGVDPDAKNNINTDDINKYGVSMSIGVLARQMESNIGLIYLYGSGDTYGTEVVNNQRVATRTDVKENHLYLMLNTIYRF